jgi:hypothetical protein
MPASTFLNSVVIERVMEKRHSIQPYKRAICKLVWLKSLHSATIKTENASRCKTRGGFLKPVANCKNNALGVCQETTQVLKRKRIGGFLSVAQH